MVFNFKGKVFVLWQFFLRYSREKTAEVNVNHRKSKTNSQS